MTQEQFNNRVKAGFKHDTPEQRLECYRFLLEVYIEAKRLFGDTVSMYFRTDHWLEMYVSFGICSLVEDIIEDGFYLYELNHMIREILKANGRLFYIADKGELQPRIDLLTNLIKSME